MHLTTNIVGCDPDDVHIGQEVAVRFEQHDDVWLPLFEPTGATDDRRPRRRARAAGAAAAARATSGSSTAPVLSGVGRSAIGRRLMVDPLSLTVDACLAAVADAGLDARRHRRAVHLPRRRAGMGMSEGGITAVEEALRMHPTWINGGGDLPGPGGSVIAAMLAVASGLCRHVLCFRTVWESTYATLGLRRRAAPARRARLHGVAGAVRRDVGRQLDRHEREPVPPPLRRDPRAARLDRAQRPRQRRRATPPRSTATR